jgi:hypothetical protein
MFCTVGNSKRISATRVNLKGMDVNSMTLIISEDKIATPATAAWHMAVAASLQKLAEGREIGMV